MTEAESVAERIEAVAMTHAKLFVSENRWVSGKPADLHLAASGFAVAAALRTRASSGEGE